MKVKELMINDLVWYVDEPIKVKHNYGKSVRYDDDHCSHEVEQSYIRPIQLTKEILMENGFLKYDANTEENYEEDPSLAPSYNYGYFPNGRERGYRANLFSTYGGGFLMNAEGIWGLHIVYVHELQHALRLCGLNDLADNFKVK